MLAHKQALQNNGSLEGTVDTNGNPTTNTSQITGLTYDRCVADCGHGSVSFDWHTFSQQFTSWLLPWLALISQLPYAYSLALSVISNRWMVKRFGRSNYLSSRLAAQTLSNLQQVSLDLPDDDHVLPSLIVIQKNQQWWQKLAQGLDYAVPKWTLASIMSVVYVVLADLFTWIDTLSGPLSNVVVNATGGGISSLWLCFLPIVIGNLQLSPKTDPNRICRAFDHANPCLFVAMDEGPPKQARGSLLINIRTEPRDAIEEDELSSAPVYFYARAFTWIRLARKVADGFDAASQHASDHRTSGVPPSKREDHLCDIRTSGDVSTMGYDMSFDYGYVLHTHQSILAHCYKESKKGTATSTFIWGASLALRHTAKTLAACNAVWLFLSAIFQFTNLDDTCWCNTSKLSLHSKAYTVITYRDPLLASIKIAWAGGLTMAFLTAALFLVALNVLRKRPAKQPESILLQPMGPESSH
ncbi:hypothetical protein F5887DRAFT_1192053 [Amanita rubescens]|nr:hypothetical protein F5887DRAFT_1192053 [Amanita rubescens]